MNPAISFPPPEPSLKLPRASAEKWAASLAEERRRLQEDHEALREREQNLREYEARLRSLQHEIEANRAAHGVASRVTPPPFLRPSSQTPFIDDSALQAAWEKLHRAREIFEAEQKNLRDDRIAIRELEAQVKHREDAVAARELRIEEREALIAAAMPAATEPDNPTLATRITRAPFNMARSVFRGKKKL